MRSSNKLNPDVLAVGISACIIIACSVLLYADYAIREGAGDAKQIGTITYKKKVAQRKYASQVVWEDLEQNTPVYNNDTIRTADLSEAIVNLEDGTGINIDENSLIQLAMTGSGINIDFSHGSISANRAAGEAGKMTIQSKEAVVSLGKGDVKLSKSGGKGMDVTVTEGTAEVRTGAVEQTVSRDEKAVITEDREAKIVRLNLKLASPRPNQNFVTAAAAMPVSFAWKKPEEVGAVSLEIARDGGFTRGVTTRPSAGTAHVENLAEGSYYWRIRALNTSTGSPEYSDMRKVSVIRDLPLRLLYPRNNEVMTYSAKPPIINLGWGENRLASEYIVEISRDPAFRSVERSVTTPLREISVDRLGAGAYYWRVRTRNAGVGAYGATSATSSFRIDRLAELGPPSLIAPAEGSRFSASMLGKNRSVMFSWTADNQVGNYEIVIARDAEFRDVAFRARSSGNVYALGEGLPPGTYHWRVSALPEGAGKAALSAANSFAVITVGAVRPGRPQVTAAAEAESGEKRVTVRFPWTVSDFRGTGVLELSRDRQFLNMVTTRRTREEYAEVGDIAPGAYYWRVRLFENDRSQIAASDALSLYVGTRGELVNSAGEIMQGKTAAEIAREEAEFNVIREEAAKRRREEQALRQKEELARKQQEDIAKKEQVELAQKQQQELARKRQEELARKQQEDITRKQQLELAQKQQQELARKRQEELARKQQEDITRKQQLELTQKQQQELARKRQEELARKQQEDISKKQQIELTQKQQQELARKRQEELARKQQEDITRKQQLELAQKQQQELARKRQEELARKKQEEIAKKQQQELTPKQQQELARKQQDELARKQQIELARRRQQELAQKQQEELAQRRQEELTRKRQQELERKQQIELARQRQEELARKRQEELAQKQQQELARKKREEADKPKPVLAIVSPVKGSEIYVNSKLRGRDTVTVSPESGARTLVEVRAGGYTTYKQNVTLAPGEKKRIDARMAVIVPVYREKYPGRRLRWRTNLASTVTSRPVISNNMIVATTKNGVLAGLNLNGTRRWQTPLGSPAKSTPAADDTAVYIVTVNGYLCSVNINTGALNWKKKVQGPLLFGAEPIVENRRVYLATSYGMVQAFAADGLSVWEKDLEEGIFSSITYDDGLLYVGTDRSRVYAINARDGSVRWSCQTDSRIFTSSPKIYKGYLFVGCYSGSIYAIDARSGWTKWVFKANSPVLSAPAFSGDSVFFGSEDGMFYSLGIFTGTKQWEFRARAPVITGPEVLGNSVLVPAGNTVYALDVASGVLNWKETLAAGINTPVTVKGAAAFVGLSNGEVVSLGSM